MTKRIAINYLLMAIIVALVLELAAYGMIYLSRPLFSEPIRRKADIYREQSEHIESWLEIDNRGRDVVDPDLGWRYQGGISDPRNRINSQGIRSDKEYAPLPPAGTLRVAAFGDSFVYSNEVVNEDAWAAIVETLFDDIEVLNYGVGGYGLDQALLRYELEGAQFSPHIVLIGFIVDDIRRVTNVYQRFASTRAGIFTKPRFRLSAEGELQLIPTPIQELEDWREILADPGKIREWGKNDQWYEPLIYDNPLYDYSALVRLASTIWIRLDNRYLDPDRPFIGDALNPSAEAYKLQMEIFRRLAAAVRADGAYPVVMFMPSRGELTANLQGRENAYAPLIEELKELGIAHLDAADAFLGVTQKPAIDSWFERGGHYSPTANRVVASWLGAELRRLGADVID